MERAELGRTIEAILLVAVEPLPPQLLAELVEEPVERVEEALDELARATSGSGVASCWPASPVARACRPTRTWRPYVERFANREVSHRLSTAALETLAIVAYRQPVSRGQISALRGVNVDGVTRLLEQRGYIEVVGHAEGPGPAGALRHDRPLLGAPRAWTRWTSCRPWRTSSPGPRWRATSSGTCSPRWASASRRPPTTADERAGDA